MLKELARHEYLGSAEEYSFLLNHVFLKGVPIAYSDIQQLCLKRPILFRHGFDSIFAFCCLLSLVKKNEGCYEINLDIEEQIKEEDKLTKLVLNKVLTMLRESNEFDLIFNDEYLDYDQDRGIYQIKSYGIASCFNNIKRLFIDLGFFQLNPSRKNILIIPSNYVDLFERFLPNRSKKKITLSELKNIILLKEKHGLEAELFVLKFERQRLSSHPLVNLITRISESNTEAGYDIESYHSDNSTNLDRFVEVKSYSGDIHFFWSRNELLTAKELGNDYYLYLVDRKSMNNDEYMPIIINDPYNNVFVSKLWKVDPESYHISMM